MVEQGINSESQIKVLSETHKNPLGVSPSEGNQGTTRGTEKILVSVVAAMCKAFLSSKGIVFRSPRQSTIYLGDPQ